MIADLAATRTRLLPISPVVLAPADPIPSVCDVVEALLKPIQSGEGQTPGGSV
jgi:hypothetical protein